ncbi:AAA family ATPase [Rhizobium sp. LCM 4573]|uniref:AAA family ATPase n=1 Tax=Rhizobium sp. LCM 4573 TaxID=1848291 RepID=UPI000E2A04EE
MKLTKFRRFASLEIKDIPSSARLVVLAGPNGSGKSSLFDALLLRYRLDSGFGGSSDSGYYNRSGDSNPDPASRIVIQPHDGGELPPISTGQSA